MNDSKYFNFEFLLFTLIFIAICIQLTSSFYHAWPFTTDDAFISWRYARHLVEGDGLYWNPTGAAVEGYSNFAWVMISALIIKLNLPIITTIKCFSCVSLLLALIFLYQLSRTFLSPLPAILPVYLFSKYHGVVWWAVSGLETSFFIMLVLFVTWQSTRAMGFVKFKENYTHPTNAPIYHWNAWVLTGIGLTLLALTRFEGIIWSLIVCTFVVCHFWRPHHFRSVGPGVRQSDMPTTKEKINYRKPMYAFVIFFAVPYALYFAWRVYYFGHIIPNSFSCKASAGSTAFQLINNYLPLAFPCFILSLPYLFSCKDCRHLLLWLPSLIYILLLHRADPIVAYNNRLFLGAFSVLVVLPVLGTQEFFSYFHYTAKKNALLSTIVILVFAYFFIPSQQAGVTDALVANYQQRNTIRLQIAHQLNRDAAIGDRVLVADCGVIPFFTRKDIVFIDGYCLNNTDMTQKPWQSIPLYALYLQHVIKPEWAIDNYYPLIKSGPRLDNELRKNGFFNHYTSVHIYKAHQFVAINGKATQKKVDYIYRVYN